jgi:hypothetical protein
MTLSLAGLITVGARPFSFGYGSGSFADEYATSLALPGPFYERGGCPAATTHTNHSVPEGATVILGVEVDYPVGLADQFCCSVAARGDYYTVVDLGPSKKYKDEHTYICTVYLQTDPAVPVTWKPANQSVTGGFAPLAPTTPDPHCTLKETLVDCIHADIGSQSQCAWSDGSCHYGPPIDCGGFSTRPGAKQGPFCVGFLLDGKPYPSGAPGRSLNSFNWTSGTISGNVSAVAMPPQVLTVGQNGWFSVEVDPPGWKICVQYNELLPDGKSSNPDSGFAVCASFGAGMLDLTRGTTSNLGITAAFGGSAGWTAKGFDKKMFGVLWGQFVIWSNSTTASPH